MANTISNIAVISFPRTASKSLVNHLAEKHNKLTAHGVLHKPEYLGKNDYNVEEIVYGHKHVLHGHWHSLHKLDDKIYQYVMENYRIATSYRRIELVKESLNRITGKDLFDEVYRQTIIERDKWTIHEHYIMSGDVVHTVEPPVPTNILV